MCDGYRCMGSAGSQQAFQEDIARLLNPPQQQAAAPLLTPDSKVIRAAPLHCCFAHGMAHAVIYEYLMNSSRMS